MPLRVIHEAGSAMTPVKDCKRRSALTALVFLGCSACSLLAQAPDAAKPSDRPPDPTADTNQEKDHLAQAQAVKTGPVRTWGTGDGKSYLIPALEIPTFLTLLSVYDRHAYPDQTEDGKKVYSSTVSSTWDHTIAEFAARRAARASGHLRFIVISSSYHRIVSLGVNTNKSVLSHGSGFGRIVTAYFASRLSIPGTSSIEPVISSVMS